MTNDIQDNESPLMTIGITCFNAQDTIERALASAAGQEWPNKEIIIVDDCSTDGSVSIVENAIKSIAGAKLVKHQENQGTGGARNSILAHAKGEFIAFFDDDDESLPQRLSAQYRRITTYEQKTGEGLIACYASGHRAYSNDYKLPLPAIGSREKFPHGKTLADYLLFFKKQPGWFYGSGTPTCSLMARKSTFDAAGGFDPDFRRLEDVDFAVRLALQGGHFIGCPEELFIQHSSSAPDKSPEVNLKAEQALALKHKDYLDSINYYHYALTWPEVRYYHYKRDYLKMGLTFLSLLMRHPVKAASHILETGPKRLVHEWKMSRKPVRPS